MRNDATTPQHPVSTGDLQNMKHHGDGEKLKSEGGKERLKEGETHGIDCRAVPFVQNTTEKN